MKLRLSHIIGLIIVAASVVFIFQNLETVTITFFKTSFSGPISLAVTITFFAGFFVGNLFLWPSIFSSKKRIKTLMKEHKILKTKLDECAIEYRTEGLGTEGDIRL